MSNALAEVTVLPMTCLRDSMLLSERPDFVGERAEACLACGELDGVNRRDSAGLMEVIRGLEGVSGISQRREVDGRDGGECATSHTPVGDAPSESMARCDADSSWNAFVCIPS